MIAPGLKTLPPGPPDAADTRTIPTDRQGESTFRALLGQARHLRDPLTLVTVNHV
jgi:hypothetical protein